MTFAMRRQRWQRAAACAAALAGALLVLGCAAQRPVLYPNAHLDDVGPTAAERDIAFCTAEAQRYVEGSGRAAETAGRTATGAATGAVVGGAVGAVLGNPGRGAAAGAAGGGSRGLLRGLFERGPDPVERRFVERCLRERGYETIGWR